MGASNAGARMAALALAWLAGVGWHLQQRELWSWPACRALTALGAAFLLAALLPRVRRHAGWWLAGAGAMVLGLGLSGWQAHERLADALPAGLEGQDVVVTGVVASLPQRRVSGLGFRFDVEEAQAGGAAVRLPRRLSLGWYAGYGDEAELTPQQQALRAGQRWRFTVRLRPPNGNLNPHGFDYELQLFEQGVRATGYVREVPAAERVGEAGGHVLQRWRQGLRDAIERQVVDPRAAGVLAALAIGDQAAIERGDWALFRDTGVAHLMSISGLHVTMFAWLAGLLAAALWRRSACAMRLWPAPSAGRWIGLGAAFAYALLAGWGVPAQRTLWMLATVAVLQGTGSRWPWPLVLLSAAVVVTTFDPWALLQPGFWLSFTAVGLLMGSAPARALDPAPALATGWRGWTQRLWRLARAGLRTQVVATLGLTPLTLVFFQQVSLVGFAANLVAIPAVTLLITPLALLGSALPMLWMLAAAGVRALAAVLEALAALPGAVWEVAAAPAWAQAAALLGAALLVWPLPWRVRGLAVPLVLPLLLPAPRVPPHGAFELLAADVGQGTAVLVRTRSKLLLYDAGPQYSRDSDAGQRVLLPLLRARGETRIDRLLLSHRDSDHVGGAAALLQGRSVGQLLSSLEPGHPLLAAGVPAQRCEAGQHWQWDGVDFEVLHPTPTDYVRARKPNAVSCVLKVRGRRDGREQSALLTGDIERDGERAMLARHAQALAADVLLVPHHGSRTSSTAELLDAVRPRVAVVQAGWRNRFGHPAPDVVARYRERGILIVTSADCGAWSWDGAAMRCQREQVLRYWHRRPEAPPLPGTLPPGAPAGAAVPP